MSRFQITVNDRSYDIQIEDPNASPVRVLVDGKRFEVSVSQQGTVQPLPSAQPDAQIEEVYVPAVASTFVETPVELHQEQETAAGTPAAPSGDLQQVTAPMPGKILDIAVSAGTQVARGDVLCNLEAMKMKSPIRCTADGTVAQVLVSEGQNVNFGDVLFAVQ